MPQNPFYPQNSRSFAVVAMEIHPHAESYHVPEEHGVTLQRENSEQNTQTVRVETTTISILLVDDHALMREGLRQLLSLEADLRVVDEAVNGFEAIQKVRRLQPDVVLMDISMPVVDGIAVTQQITHEFPAVAVIMLTMHRQDQQVLQAIKSGARGYLLKTASSRELAQTIRQVHAGQVQIEPELTGTIVSEVRRLSNLSADGSSLSELSEKETDILRCVAMGLSNKEIAEQLAYSEKTVKNYLSIIFQKLNIRDRTQAAIFAFRHGLISVDEW
ncbi:MAG TPA: response regulator transcription factor [Ktedonobacteraceae bacterium]